MRFDRDTEMAKALRVDHRPALDETIDPTHPVIASHGSARCAARGQAPRSNLAPEWMVMADVTAEMPLSQLYATSTRICQSGMPISNRESAGKADGLFDLGSWK
jgi:hypothetical protein